ncbi:unnamed protein product [Pedinophyceae sp. YPF-701]|nr:unnamed protein product [Pedinophyceae sp. YPF-701]
MEEGGGPSGPKKPAKQRRVGEALSLEQFAAARKSGYDKRHEIQKKKNLSAKRVNKLRKLMRQMAEKGELAPVLPGAPADEEATEGGGGPGREAEEQQRRATPREKRRGPQEEDEPVAPEGGKERRAGKKRRHFDTLKKYSGQQRTKRAEAEAARAEAHRAAEERQRKAEETQKRRKEKTAVLRKRTRRGQPVMKHRLDDILGKLTGGVCSRRARASTHVTDTAVAERVDVTCHARGV